MKDKEILEEVYRRVVTIATNGDANVPSQERFKEFRDFIETEWQREDEIETKLDKIERKERGIKNEKDDHPLTKSDEGLLPQEEPIRKLRPAQRRAARYIESLRRDREQE